jgi:L-threonylcarbamoyladenylate synthase
LAGCCGDADEEGRWPEAELSAAVSALRAGGLVAFPTETVYGLGADARQPSAIGRLYRVKQRPADHPLIVHLGDVQQLEAWSDQVSSEGWRLAERFWPGPLTLVLRKAPHVSPLVTGGQDSIGLRVPAHPLALEFLRRFGGGVAAPSANRFGRVSPTTAAHVRADLGNDVDWILDGGPCRIGLESTIVDCTRPLPRVLRPGGLTLEDLSAALGFTPEVARAADVRTPGQLPSHYAPRARMLLVRADELAAQAERFRQQGCRVVTLADHQLQPERLYAELRAADDQEADWILAVPPPADHYGWAVLDRLEKAAAPRDRAGSNR